MHEMGVVIQIVKTANNFALQNGASHVKKLNLEIGEGSAVLPKYVYAFFDDVIPDYPVMQGCELEIDTVPAVAFCLDCGNTFYPGRRRCDPCEAGEDVECINCDRKSSEPRRLRDEKLNTPCCPKCGSELFKIIDGNSIMIRDMEIV